MTTTSDRIAVVGIGDAVSSAIARHLGTTVSDAGNPLPSEMDGVVVVAGADVTASPLKAMDSRAWRRLAQEPVWRTITVLQQAWTSMRDRGGSIVLITPTVGVAGSPGLVPYTTAMEGIRAMAKSAARQWAEIGVVVNIVGVPLELLAPEMADAAQHLTVPATSGREGLLNEVGETVAYLLRRRSGHLTGQTIIVDGGSVMLP